MIPSIPNPRQLAGEAKAQILHEREFAEAVAQDQEELAFRDALNSYITQTIPARIAEAVSNGKYYCNVADSHYIQAPPGRMNDLYQMVLRHCLDTYTSGEYSAGEYTYEYEYDGFTMHASTVQIRWDGNEPREE